MNKIIEEMAELLTKTQNDLYLEVSDIKGMSVDAGYMIYSRSSEPKPMLCVHLDTINTHSSDLEEELIIEADVEAGILSVSPDCKAKCLGGDDRAGVWIALKMIEWMEKTGNYKYDIGFFRDEEIGCKGSTLFEEHKHKYNTTCYIGLDRKSSGGVQEVATYGEDNYDLIRLVESYGYIEHFGSVTDASNLAGDVACINLSVGYDREHTKSEILYLNCMTDTLENLKIMEFDGRNYGVDYSGYTATTPMDEYYEVLERENETFRAFLQDLGYNPNTILDYTEDYYGY